MAVGNKLQELKQKVGHTEAQWRERWQELTVKAKIGSDRSLSILNGLVGDFLQEKGLPIAVQMSFYYNRKPVELSHSGIARAYDNPSSKICIMVHGLNCTEGIWEMDKNSITTYASRLSDEFGYTPMYVRYNTGLHISHNGQMLSSLVETLLRNYPKPVEEIIFITHSMGGLVTRSACYYGSGQENPWTDKVRQLYFLGSPHLGADLEKFGSVIAGVLKSAPLPYTSLLAQVYNMRSAGIKDLRYGYVRDEDWQDQDQNAPLNNNKQTVPLLEGAEHFVITGTVFKDNQKVLNEFFGDALVRKHSATGGHPTSPHHLPFLPENQKEFETINHVKMAHSEEVYQQIRGWVSQDHSPTG